MVDLARKGISLDLVGFHIVLDAVRFSPPWLMNSRISAIAENLLFCQSSNGG